MKASITRAGAIVAVALTWGSYEIVLGGARSQVLSMVVTVLLAPAALELDMIRRRRNGKQDTDQS